MHINFKLYRRLLSCCIPLIIGLTLAFTPANGAQDKPTKIEMTDLIVKSVGGTLQLRRYIDLNVELKVGKLPEFLQQPGYELPKLILYIDGAAFKGLQPSLIGTNTLRFDLKHTDLNKKAWDTILSRRETGKFFERSVSVTVGLENGTLAPSVVTLVPLTVIREWSFYTFVVIFLAVIALFWWLAMKSDILRDPGPQPVTTNRIGKPDRKPYSLARTQMAFWFFIIVSGYVFIWIVTNELDSLTPMVLGLMGISAATGLGAAVVDSNNRTEQENQRRVLDEKRKGDEVEVAKLTSEISALNAAINASPAPANIDEQKMMLATKQADLAAKEAEKNHAMVKIQEVVAEAKPAVSKSFFSDILSDDDGVSFHRFQIFAWTIVLIIIFIAEIYNTLSMPEFNGTLLALMGISGGTFIGFKLPAQQG